MEELFGFRARVEYLLNSEGAFAYGSASDESTGVKLLGPRGIVVTDLGNEYAQAMSVLLNRTIWSTD